MRLHCMRFTPTRSLLRRHSARLCDHTCRHSPVTSYHTPSKGSHLKIMKSPAPRHALRETTMWPWGASRRLLSPWANIPFVRFFWDKSLKCREHGIKLTLHNSGIIIHCSEERHLSNVASFFFSPSTQPPSKLLVERLGKRTRLSLGWIWPRAVPASAAMGEVNTSLHGTCHYHFFCFIPRNGTCN